MSDTPAEQGKSESAAAKPVVGLGIAGPARRPGAKKAAPAAQPPKDEGRTKQEAAPVEAKPAEEPKAEPLESKQVSAAKPTVGLGIAGPAKRPGARKDASAAAQAEPAQAESAKAGSAPVEAKPAEEPKPEPVKPEPVKPEPVKPEPVKPEPVKPEPVATEPKPEAPKPEPAKPEPERTPAAKAVKAPAGTVRAVRSFVAAHGGSGNVLLQNIGRAGVRITLIGKDGILGDEVARDMPTAKAVVAAVDGLELAEEWTRELVSAVTPAPGHARKMAGWVANA